MTAGGILFMTLAWTFVIGLFLYCFWKMFRGKKEE